MVGKKQTDVPIRHSTESNGPSKVPLCYFTIETQSNRDEVIQKFQSERHTHRPLATYRTTSRISRGSYGHVFAVKDNNNKSYAIKMVQDSLPQESLESIHKSMMENTFTSTIIHNAIQEAHILYSLQRQANVIGFHSVGYCIQADTVDSAGFLAVLVVLEIGTTYTLQHFIPLHTMHMGVMKASEREFVHKYGLSMDSITCMAQEITHSDRNREIEKVSPEFLSLPLLQLSLSVIDAAVSLHRKSIVHRDFKPENFVFCRAKREERNSRRCHSLYNAYFERQCLTDAFQRKDDQKFDPHRTHALKLIDFGCALQCSPYTREPSIGGTSQYISPEFARHLVRLPEGGHRAFTREELEQNDTWSVGIVLLEMLLGKCHTGLIEGLLQESHKQHKGKSTVQQTDRTMLKLVASLSAEKIKSFTRRALRDSERLFQSKLGYKLKSEIIPREWVNAVLSLLQPLPSKRGNLKSVRVVCRKLITDARRKLFQFKRPQSFLKTLASTSESIEEELNESGNSSSESENTQGDSDRKVDDKEKQYEKLEISREKSAECLETLAGTSESIQEDLKDSRNPSESEDSQEESSGNVHSSSKLHEISEASLHKSAEVTSMASTHVQSHILSISTSALFPRYGSIEIVRSSPDNLHAAQSFEIEPVSNIFKDAISCIPQGFKENATPSGTNPVIHTKDTAHLIDNPFSSMITDDSFGDVTDMSVEANQSIRSVIKQQDESDEESDDQVQVTPCIDKHILSPRRGGDLISNSAFGSPRRLVSSTDPRCFTTQQYSIFSRVQSISSTTVCELHSEPSVQKTPFLTRETYQCFSRFPAVKYAADEYTSRYRMPRKSSYEVDKRIQNHILSENYKSQDFSIVHSFLYGDYNGHSFEFQANSKEHLKNDDHEAVFLPYVSHRLSSVDQSNPNMAIHNADAQRAWNQKPLRHSLYGEHEATSPSAGSWLDASHSPSNNEGARTSMNKMKGVKGEDSWVL